MPSEQFCCFEKCLCSDERSSRTKSSIRTYCYNLCWLAKRMDGFEKDGTPGAEAVMQYMTENDVPLKRRQMSYSAMKVYHNARNEIAESKKYAHPLVDVKHSLDREYNKQERTDRQKSNWIDYKCLKKHANELRQETFKLDKHILWDKDQFARAQLALILTFHLKYPIRRDLCTVQYNVEGNEQGNNLVDETKEIVFRDHKTKRYHPEFRMKLDRLMWRLIQLLRSQHALRGLKSGYLLLNRYWKQLHRNAFTNWMKREMGKLEACKGKSVGCLGIRHSVITHKRRNDSTLEKRNQFAYHCMHSAKRNEQYRVH